jgi:heme-degrading monooxygenase HmoA
MFARKLEFDLVLNKKDEFLRKVRDEVLPILRRQDGFIDLLGLTNEIKVEKALMISLWESREHALEYDKKVFPKITNMLKPYLMSPFVVTPYMVETTVSEHILSMVA